MGVLQTVIDFILTSDLVLYLGLIADGVMSIFLCIKSKKAKKTSSDPLKDDIQALIDYHENVAKKLKEKFNKE